MYDKTMIALNEIRSFSAHATNLSRIAARTEDEQLRALLETLLSALHAASMRAKQKDVRSAPGKLVGAEALLPPVAPLSAYCQRMLVNKKPEWQVLAERHGWTPPTK